MNLFLDDIRYPSEVSWIKWPDVKWFIVRNYNDFVYFINNFGIPEIISFDHDLGPLSIKEYGENGLNYSYDRVGDEKTGLHCLQYLFNIINEKHLKPPENFYIHTVNPIGAQYMINLISREF